jgi:hypothetical protein
MLKFRFTGLVAKPELLLAVTIVSRRQQWWIEGIHQQKIESDTGLKLAFNQLKKQLPRRLNRYSFSLGLDEVLYKQTVLQPPIHPDLVELEIDNQLSGLTHNEPLHHDYMVSNIDAHECLHLFMCKRKTLELKCQQLPVLIVGWHLTDLITMNKELSKIGHYADPEWVIEITPDCLQLISTKLAQGVKVFNFSQAGIQVAVERLNEYLSTLSGQNHRIAVVGSKANTAQLIHWLNQLNFEEIIDLSMANISAPAGFVFERDYLALACALSARAWYQVSYD